MQAPAYLLTADGMEKSQSRQQLTQAHQIPIHRASARFGRLPRAPLLAMVLSHQRRDSALSAMDQCFRWQQTFPVHQTTGQAPPAGVLSRRWASVLAPNEQPHAARIRSNV